MATSKVKLVECPRDAMQGLPGFISTSQKIDYLNALLQVGFDTLDFGSFVSPKAIPQLRDTAEVLPHLQWCESPTKLLAIVANRRGGEQAVQYEAIRYLGYPFSISEIFQQRNTGKSIAQSVEIVKELLQLAADHGKEVVIYLSMGFGNPYREKWSVNLVEHYVEKMANLGVRILSLSDTIGTANPHNIEYLFGTLIPDFPELEIGAHLHTRPDEWYDKVAAAYENGCCRFDGAIRGLGGCPFAEDQLVGNMPTEKLLTFGASHHWDTGVSPTRFESALNVALQTFAEELPGH